jgi:hypothetical protein
MIFIHNRILLSIKEDKILSFAGKWMELENMRHDFSQAQRPNAACSLPYADYRPKTNVAIL